MIESMSNASGTLRIALDRDACCGYGICQDICPRLYSVEGSGIVELLSDSIPVELEASAIEAAEACPQYAIKIERSE